MNIFLVPYAPMRHLVVGLYCAGAGLLAWWALMLALSLGGPVWAPGADGVLYLGGVGATIAGASVLAEHSLRRSPLWKRLAFTLLAAGLSFVFGVAGWLLWSKLLAPVLLAPLVRFSMSGLGLFCEGVGADGSGSQLQALLDAVDADIADSSLVSLRYRLGAFVCVGVGASLGPLAARLGRGILYHLSAGLLAGLLAAAVWHLLGYNEVITSLYWAGAGGAFTWGLVFGIFAWPLPDDLYAGWLRVLSAERFGRRIPIDDPQGKPKERFVGHFPRGLDLFLPAEARAMEMHVSVAVDARHRYFVRGLSLAPTRVRRFLERVNLAYDPTRPAPLETRLSSGDGIQLGEGEGAAELEFLMLPREER
ncbi:MAG: hypothetical protein ABIO70_17400 [Pseudomonadota bacterium]